MVPHVCPDDNVNGRANRTSSPVLNNEPTAAPSTTLRIEREADDLINVGAGGKLIVPREHLDAGLDDGEEVSLGSPLKIRKPGPHEWVILRRESELGTRLLVYKDDPESLRPEFYYVAPELRSLIKEQLRFVRVLLFFSPKRRTFGLWIIKTTPGISWCENLAELLKKPPEYFAANVIRVIPDKAERRDRIRAKPWTATVNWPQQPMEELLGEALGPSRIITSADHPIYRELTEGEEVV